MTGHYPTTLYLPSLSTNVTQLNTTTVMTTTFKRKSSSSPLLWIPYILIGVSCVVFLAVHFWCYHKRNRQRYLRKREEKRVKCGLMERRRITTLMVARYQSDLDFSDIAETEIPGTINGDLHKVTDPSANDDGDVSANGNIHNGRLRVDIVPELVPTSAGSGPFTYSGSDTLAPQQMREKGANDPTLESSQLAPSTSITSSPQNVDLALGHHNRLPTRRDMTTAPDSLTCLPVSASGEASRYSWAGSDHYDEDDEEDAASAPPTPMSPGAFSVKPYTTLKSNKFPNVIYTTLNKSLSQEKLPHLHAKSKGRKQAKESLGDLYEYNMNMDSPTDSGADSVNDTQVLSDLGVETLNFLDCSHKNDALWKCTAPRASPESDLDSLNASPNVADDRRRREESTQQESGSAPSASDLHRRTEHPSS